MPWMIPINSLGVQQSKILKDVTTDTGMLPKNWSMSYESPGA